MNKTLRIPINAISEANKSKDRFEGFAFAVWIKKEFVSSSLHYGKKRNGVSGIRAMKKMLGMGSDRFIRVKNNALKYNYIRIEGNNIISNILRDRGSISGCIPFMGNLDRVMKTLRNVLVTQEIVRLNYVSHTISKAHGVGVGTTCTYNQFKIARAKYGEQDFNDVISYKKLGEKVNITRLQAIKSINDLVARRTISKKTNITILGDAVDAQSLSALNNGGYGFYLNKHVNGKLSLVHQTSNSYSVNDTSMFKYDWSYDRYIPYGTFTK